MTQEITPLTPDQAMDWVLQGRGTRIVEFYASWCIYHMLTIRKLELLRQAVSGDIQFGTVDVVGHEEAFKSIGISQVPTIGCFHASTTLLWMGDTELNTMLLPIQELIAREVVV